MKKTYRLKLLNREENTTYNTEQIGTAEVITKAGLIIMDVDKGSEIFIPTAVWRRIEVGNQSLRHTVKPEIKAKINGEEIIYATRMVKDKDSGAVFLFLEDVREEGTTVVKDILYMLALNPSEFDFIQTQKIL